MPMTDRSQWPQVDLPFKLWPHVLKRAARGPRERRMKSAEEEGKIIRHVKCKRCGQFGHMMKTCNETIYDSDASPPAPLKPKKVAEGASSPTPDKEKMIKKQKVNKNQKVTKNKQKVVKKKLILSDGSLE
ncbi:hypothetical protein BS78_06G214100 [Paspalum vaginatum]|nr:hypothetical protein BS78_06G214100 [Paspalum vaginatum]